MRRSGSLAVVLVFGLAVLLVFGGSVPAPAEGQPQTLLEARRGFKTKLLRHDRDETRLGFPPSKLFSRVSYRTRIGKMSAYVSKPPAKGKKYPAIVWITGGFPPGGADSSAWETVSRSDDQSAKAYRLADVIMMYPTLRGSFGNPGVQEYFYGEVDDVLAAAGYLRRLSYVDPKRIYLGGHSTGGTLALLVAESTNQFRAIFSFGPVADPIAYGQDVPFDPDREGETRLRAPIHFLGAVRSPTFVIEGASGTTNIESVRELKRRSSNKSLHFFRVKGADHFTVLAPVNEVIATKIAQLKGKSRFKLTGREIQKAFDEDRP